MKKVLLTLVVANFIFLSCKKVEKKETATETTQKAAIYSIDVNATKINWIAYKTTEKLPVNGQFDSIKIENIKSTSTINEALNGLEFSIPITSIYTKDTTRDGKLRKFFFGTMKNTNFITGTVSIENDSIGSINLTMNEISHALPFKYSITNNVANIKAILDLNNWQAQAALKALNIACKQLHSGKDGIPKTWNEVAINVVTAIKEN